LREQYNRNYDKYDECININEKYDISINGFPATFENIV
jgi:hypothetical protein